MPRKSNCNQDPYVERPLTISGACTLVLIFPLNDTRNYLSRSTGRNIHTSEQTGNSGQTEHMHDDAHAGKILLLDHALHPISQLKQHERLQCRSKLARLVRRHAQKTIRTIDDHRVDDYWVCEHACSCMRRRVCNGASHRYRYAHASAYIPHAR